MRRLLRRLLRDDRAFSMVEAMVAVTILMIAIMMSMQPMMAAMVRIADSRTLTVAENLAQAEIEAIRALDYEDVGSEGYTPDGVLERTRTEEVEGKEYTVEVRVTYEGSLTGLNVVDQGGDGVEGTWDPGIDYKFVQVTVTGADTNSPPVVMETIVAPGNIGAHEGIANAKVTLAKYEPFEPSDLPYPSVKIQSPPAFPIKSGSTDEVQIFPAIPEGDYTVSLDVADGWIIHPDDAAAGLQEITAVAGLLVSTTLRVYRPARLIVNPTDAETGEVVSDARIRLVHNPSGQQADYAPGVFVIENLFPDAYDVTVSATEYFPYEDGSVNIPSGYPDPEHILDVQLVPVPPPTTTTTSSTSTTSTTSTTTTTIPGSTTTTSTTTTTTTTPAGTVQVVFTVKDNTGRVVNGATVEVPHPSLGTLTAVTDAYGNAYMDLEEGIDFTATASTAWGHGPDSETFDPADDTTIGLYLYRQYGTGLYVLGGGYRAELMYGGDGGWVLMPSNYQGEASFAESSGWRRVAKRCTANGDIKGEKWVYVRSGRNSYTTIYGSCP